MLKQLARFWFLLPLILSWLRASSLADHQPIETSNSKYSKTNLTQIKLSSPGYFISYTR